MTREDTDVSYVPWRRMTHAVPDVSFETHGTIGSTSVIISRPDNDIARSTCVIWRRMTQTNADL